MSIVWTSTVSSSHLDLPLPARRTPRRAGRFHLAATPALAHTRPCTRPRGPIPPAPSRSRPRRSECRRFPSCQNADQVLRGRSTHRPARGPAGRPVSQPRNPALVLSPESRRGHPRVWLRRTRLPNLFECRRLLPGIPCGGPPRLWLGLSGAAGRPGRGWLAKGRRVPGARLPSRPKCPRPGPGEAQGCLSPGPGSSQASATAPAARSLVDSERMGGEP